jgi:GNAT superfamily N-acetyltransferase
MNAEDIQIDYLVNHQEWIEPLALVSYDLWTSVYAATGRTLDDAIQSYRDRARIGSIPLAFVALVSDHVVGAVSLKPSDIDIRPDFSPWLGGLYVDPEYRRRGIGSLLIEKVIQEAEELGFSELYLWTPSAESLYAKHGWRPIEELEYCGLGVQIMHREVTANRMARGDA